MYEAFVHFNITNTKKGKKNKEREKNLIALETIN